MQISSAVRVNENKLTRVDGQCLMMIYAQNVCFVQNTVKFDRSFVHHERRSDKKKSVIFLMLFICACEWLAVFCCVSFYILISSGEASVLIMTTATYVWMHQSQNFFLIQTVAKKKNSFPFCTLSYGPTLHETSDRIEGMMVLAPSDFRF